MKTVWLMAMILVATPTSAQDVDHRATVIRVKDDLVRRGVSLSGACGALAITRRVAWALRGEDAGLLDKPAGNQ